ncbi:expressed unknown protein [Ectocarpus siliculosus]|uniref:Uncharacterized protein n=1 Tax=Ectocarpus siliculosus TaxID=2880 RepID=D7G7G7_ECTSI|nr:expressed unknown protein [Ectocarpus siliculosus]|eukprot:CBJ27709.1 expressed unknown protein [Ectocarpus siliculosus]
MAFPSLNGLQFNKKGHLRPVEPHGAPPVAGSSNASSDEGDRGAVAAAAGAEVGTTLLFMHLWKCAGSSLRHLLRDWAEAKEQDIGIVVRCTDVVSKTGKICLKHHSLINERFQAPFIRLHQVVAGHFTWGFQNHVRQPYVMFTTLRNPLELFVSGQQYLNRKASRHFAHAVSLVEDTILRAIKQHQLRGDVMVPEGMGNTKSVGFIYRLVDPVQANSTQEGLVGGKTLSAGAQEAKDNLDTFWLVGVIEQYQGFMAVLQAMMDPNKSERDMWKRYAVGKYNTSPQGAGKVLAAIDPALVQEFNETLSHQWEVYSYAVDLYKHRCHQMLHTRDLDMCEVPVAPSQYTLTELERESLYQEMHPEEVSFNATEMVRAQHLWDEFRGEGSTIRNPREAEALAFFELHGFDFTDPEKRDNFVSRLRIGMPTLALGEDVFGSDDRTPEEIAAAAATEEQGGEDVKIGGNVETDRGAGAVMVDAVAGGELKREEQKKEGREDPNKLDQKAAGVTESKTMNR